MGQTLTHGVYLPDEGERNCYSGLASNWQILDGSVGTIAAHTAALAGKAPLVHTHSKADITDFPAYGTTAGTICEGNDSRLSDARTPVAHTHGKADVTDLFNSANTWTALNSYDQSIQITANFDIGTTPSSDVYGGFNFGNGTSNIGNVTARINSGGATFSRLNIGNKFANGALDPNGTWKYAELQVGLRANGDRFIYTDCLWRSGLTPYDSSVSIGDSTHQWNNLYAKNYFYNGTAWGLDKENTWSGNQTYNGVLSLSSSSDVVEQFKQKLPKDVTTSNDAMARVNALIDSSGHYVVVETLGHWSNYVAKNITLKYKNDSAKQGVVELRLYSDGSGIFYPQSPFGCDLGNIYNKWKTLNGCNPGALSLPNVSDGVVVVDTTTFQWNTDWGYTPLFDGWISIWVPNSSATKRRFAVSQGYLRYWYPIPSGEIFRFSFPVVKNVSVNLAFTSDIEESVAPNIYLLKAIGNV